jgi:transcriptional regulator GlxA family with amidase domain
LTVSDTANVRLQQGLLQVVRVLRQIERQSPDVLNKAALATSLLEGILAMFCERMATNRRKPSHRTEDRPSYMRLARLVSAYMEANISEPVRIATLCSITRASWKTLQRAFVATYNVPPKQYLTMLRLALARRRLLQGSPRQIRSPRSPRPAVFPT